MMNSKQLVRGAFETANLTRLPFIPWVFTHAARLEQVPLRRMFTDPTQYTRCLQNAQKLYGYDGIIGSFDSSLEIEIGGCAVRWWGDYEAPTAITNPGLELSRLNDINVESAAKTGRFGTVIESLRRINKVSGATMALAAVVTGPLTLMTGLTGRDSLKDLTDRLPETIRNIEAAAGFLLKIVQVYCQLELDIIVIADKLIAGLPAEHISRIHSALSPVLNTIRFYNAYSVLLPGALSPDNVTNLLNLGFDGIVSARIDANSWQNLKNGRPGVLGKAIPTAVLKSSAKEVQEYLAKYFSEKMESGVFLTTESEVPWDTPPDNIHLVMKEIFRRLRP